MQQSVIHSAWNLSLTNCLLIGSDVGEKGRTQGKTTKPWQEKEQYGNGKTLDNTGTVVL